MNRFCQRNVAVPDDFIPRTDLIAVECKVYAETDNGILVSAVGTANYAVMLPKSQIEIDEVAKYGDITVTLQKWLAIEKELV